MIKNCTGYHKRFNRVLRLGVIKKKAPVLQNTTKDKLKPEEIKQNVRLVDIWSVVHTMFTVVVR